METMTQSQLREFTAGWNKTALNFNAKDIETAEVVMNEMNFPSTKVEAWKYTRLTKLAKQKFTPAIETSISNFETIEEGTTKLVFVNGIYQNALSNTTGAGIQVQNLATQAQIENNIPVEGEVFNAMNTLFAQDGASIIIEKNQTAANIHLVFIQAGASAANMVRNQIKAEAGSKATIIMHFQSEEGANGFSNIITEVDVKEQAHLTLYQVQVENEASFHINSQFVKQARDSYFHIHTTTLNGSITRNNLNIDVNGSNADTHLNGMYLGHGNMHVDNHTIVDHKVAHCESNELYKGVMADKSTAVFNGKVFVRKDAQKINAFQSNGNVLLSDDATVNSKPELEIYADDVKCSHGSTTGQLDEEAVFYLRSRGISEKAARKLMVSAFVGDVIDKIEDDSVKSFIYGKLVHLFGWDF